MIVIKMFTKFGRRIEEHSEDSNKELENIKKNQSELNNMIKEMKKYTRRNQQQAKWYRKIEQQYGDKIVKITQSEQQKENRILKNKDSLRDV